MANLSPFLFRPTPQPITPASPAPTPSPTASPTGKVKGLIFRDVNGNGEKDPNEPGIEDVDVVIFDSNGGVQTVTTDESGMYMAVVPAGPAVIDIDELTLPPGAIQTAGEDPSRVTVPPGGVATDEDGFTFPTDPPTKSPTPRPTLRPTKRPTPSPPTKKPTAPPPGGCVTAEITFDELPDGTVLEPGEYISDQYKPFYGISFSSIGKGALGNHPRLFDSANPGKKVDGGFCGDKDLGAPNRECPGGGPGKGDAGGPDSDYPNCEPQGNVLIIQEDNRDNRCGDIPDDNQDGGIITIDFSPVAVEVFSFDMLDVDYPVRLVVVYFDEDGNEKEKGPIDAVISGDNSLQTIEVDCKNVVQLRLYLKRSGALTSLRFCYDGKDYDTYRGRELRSLRATTYG